jgi:hypothetical protein
MIQAASLARRGRLAGLERRLDAERQRGSIVQVHREDLAGHALDRGHRAERLEGVEDVLDVVVHPSPQAYGAVSSHLWRLAVCLLFPAWFPLVPDSVLSWC